MKIYRHYFRTDLGFKLEHFDTCESFDELKEKVDKKTQNKELIKREFSKYVGSEMITLDVPSDG